MFCVGLLHMKVDIMEEVIDLGNELEASFFHMKEVQSRRANHLGVSRQTVMINQTS